VSEERIRERAERGVTRDPIAGGQPSLHEVRVLFRNALHPIEDQTVTRRAQRNRSVLARRMRRADEVSESGSRQILERKAAPLFFVSRRKAGAQVSLEGRQTVLEQPLRLAPPNTEPLDRFAVERQCRRGRLGGKGHPMAPCICSVIRRFISMA